VWRMANGEGGGIATDAAAAAAAPAALAAPPAATALAARWGQVDPDACALSNANATVTRQGNRGTHPRAYAQGALPAGGTCVVSIAIERLPMVRNSISIGVVRSDRVGQQPGDGIGVYAGEVGKSTCTST